MAGNIFSLSLESLCGRSRLNLLVTPTGLHGEMHHWTEQWTQPTSVADESSGFRHPLRDSNGLGGVFEKGQLSSELTKAVGQLYLVAPSDRVREPRSNQQNVREPNPSQQEYHGLR